MSDRLKFVWPPVLVALVFLGAWQLLVVTQEIKPFLLPYPSLLGQNFLVELVLFL